MKPLWLRFWITSLAVLALAGVVRAGSATSVTGLYYTGVNNSGGLLNGGAQDSHWKVVYAKVGNNTYNSYYGGTTQYTGAARVVSGNYIDGAWTQNTSSAQWITAPGAVTDNGTANIGGDLLPGNGNTGTNRAQYVYMLEFNIGGTGSGDVTNNVAINMTIAADDQYKVYVNPQNPTINSDGTVSFSTAASATRTSAWNNTTSVSLQNYGSGGANNADFVIGTNYIVIVVDNTNSLTGSSTNTAINPSGLLVYQVGSAVLINGQPVPEVGAWMPLLGAVALYGGVMRRRRTSGLSKN